MRRLALALVATVLLVVPVATVAVVPAASAAESFSVETSDPAEDAEVGTLPATVSVTFSEELTDQTTLQVVGAEGQRIDDGQVQVAGRRVLVGLTTTEVPEGTYRLVYRAVSSLGEELGGQVQFRVGAGGSEPEDEGEAAPAVPSATPSAGASSDVRITEIEEGGESKWAPLWILGFLVITSALIVYIVKAGLTSAPGEDDDQD